MVLKTVAIFRDCLENGGTCSGRGPVFFVQHYLEYLETPLAAGKPRFPVELFERKISGLGVDHQEIVHELLTELPLFFQLLVKGLEFSAALPKTPSSRRISRKKGPPVPRF